MIRVHRSLPPLPIRPEAWEWLTKQYGITLEVHDPKSTRGGGYWHPDLRHVELFTAQEEAAIHEIAHAWWEERRKDEATRLAFLEAVVRLSKETDPRYRDAARLAYVYEHGDPSTGFPGMFDNDWERYAGLASGTMGRPERLPEYIRHFYEGLFD